jgi:hypothetical protein
MDTIFFKHDIGANLRHIVNTNTYCSVTFRFLGTRSYDFNKCEHMRVMFMHLCTFKPPLPSAFYSSEQTCLLEQKPLKGQCHAIFDLNLFHNGILANFLVDPGPANIFKKNLKMSDKHF